MSKRCSNCGFEMGDNDRFCIKCGTPFPEPGAEQSQPQMNVAADQSQPQMNMGADPGQQQNFGFDQNQQQNFGFDQNQQQNFGFDQNQQQNFGFDQNQQQNFGFNQNQQQDFGGVPSGGINKETDKKLTRIIAGVLGVIALIVIISCAGSCIGRYTGYNGTLRKMCSAMEDTDMDELEDLTSSVSNTICKDIFGKSYKDLYEESVMQQLERYEEEVGNIKSIKYKVTDSSDVTKIKMKRLKEEWKEDYSVDVDDIKKMKVVDLELTVKGDEDKAVYYVSDLYLVKEEGGWKLLSSYYAEY